MCEIPNYSKQFRKFWLLQFWTVTQRISKIKKKLFEQSTAVSPSKLPALAGLYANIGAILLYPSGWSREKTSLQNQYVQNTYRIKICWTLPRFTTIIDWIFFFLSRKSFLQNSIYTVLEIAVKNKRIPLSFNDRCRNKYNEYCTFFARTALMLYIQVGSKRPRGHNPTPRANNPSVLLHVTRQLTAYLIRFLALPAQLPRTYHHFDDAFIRN